MIARKALLAVGWVALAIPMVGAQPLPLLPADLPVALQAQLALSNPHNGAALPRAQADIPVRLTVSLTDATTGQPPRGMGLRGFARPIRAGAGRCEQAARAYLTTGAVPEGAVSFDTPAFVVLSEDNSLGVIDPRLNLQSANMIAAHRLPGRPGGIVIDPVRGRVLASLPAEGRIVSLPLTGGDVEGFADGLAEPSALLLGQDTLWIATRGDLQAYRMDGRQMARFALGSGLVHLRDDGAGGPLAFTKDGTMWRTGARQDLGFALSDLAPAGPAAVIALRTDVPEAQLIYADAPEAPVKLPLGRSFRKISADPEARFAVAWTPGDSAFVLMDLALGRVVQAAAFNSGFGNSPVSAVHLSRDKGFLQSHEGGFVAVLDLGSVKAGQAMQMVQVRLGTTSPTPPEDAGPLLLPLGASGQVMAVDPGLQTGFLIDAMAKVDGQPPMEATRLRGGIPRAVHVADRRLIEAASGRFETTWAFAPGPWEVVLTTGPGGMTRCLPFTVRGKTLPADVTVLRMDLHPVDGPVRAGQATRLVLQFRDGDGKVVAVPPLDLLIPALNSSWREVRRAETGAQGALILTLTPPHGGAFAVQPLHLPMGLALRSATVLIVEE